MAFRKIILFAGVLAHGICHAEYLIDFDEMTKYQSPVAPSAAEKFNTDPDAPKIVVFQPDVDKAIKAPFPIEIFFQPANGSKVSWDSFKVLYGNYQFDITNRFLKEARLSENGLYIPKADIPPGYHKLTIRIADERKKYAQKDFLVMVEK